MLRFAVIVLVVGTVIGAIMPSGKNAPASTETSHIARFEEDTQSASSQVDLGNGAITLKRQSDGHFYAGAQVNGVTINFLVDTGATGVALTASDAQRAMVPTLSGEHGVVGSGAGGDVTGQYVKLDRLSLGAKEVHDVNSVVIDGGEQSLLGQSFLSQFASVEIRGDTMVLH